MTAVTKMLECHSLKAQLAGTVWLLLMPGGAAAAPAWAKSQTQVLSGNLYKVVCSGTGPALDLGRARAVESCRASAVSMLRTSGRFRLLVVETESDIAMHQTVELDIDFSGLNCRPLEESIEETEGQVKVWMRCEFDLSKAAVETPKASDQTDHNTGRDRQGHAAQAIDSLELSSKSKPMSAKPTDQKSSTRRIIIGSVPPCSELVVRGERSRVVRCTVNPQPMTVYAGDQDIVVRATGYLPKTIGADDLREGGVFNVLLTLP